MRKEIKKRKKRIKRRRDVLEGRPQRKGVVEKVMIRAPKKPNSANRKVARIRIKGVKGRKEGSKRREERVVVYIPGEGHKIEQHKEVLIRGGRVRDLPGVRHKIIRGAREVGGVEGRKQARSKYGTKKSY